MSLSKTQKKKIVQKHQKHEKDTGSAEVQLGLLTKRIVDLAKHLKKHPKDNHSRRGLLMMVGKRRRLLKFLKRENPASYEKVTEEIGVEV